MEVVLLCCLGTQHGQQGPHHPVPGSTTFLVFGNSFYGSPSTQFVTVGPAGEAGLQGLLGCRDPLALLGLQDLQAEMDKGPMGPPGGGLRNFAAASAAIPWAALGLTFYSGT